MKRKLIFFTVIIGVALLSSCGPGSEERAEKVRLDSIGSADTLATGIDSAMPVDADEKREHAVNPAAPAPVSATKPYAGSAVVPADAAQKTKGVLVYYCPGRMLENTDNNVSVTITKAALRQAIEQLGDKVAATTGKPVELIQKDITGSSILIASKMKVELKYGEKDFETIYKPENDDQIFDGNNDMNWDWIVKPMRVGTLQLSIIVSAYDEKNGRWIAAQTPPKIFHIKVQVDPRGYFAKLWSFLEINPEWLFVQILFPLVAFFFGRRQGKKSSKPEAA